MRTFKSLLKVAAALAFAALINAGMMFALDPYGSKSEIMWFEYRQQKDLDLVFVGTSLSERAFDPAVIDAACGTSSFNMATPGQKVEESYLALKAAVDEHEPKTMVYGLEFNNLQGEDFPDPGRAFLRYKGRDDIVERVRDAIFCLSNERCYAKASSINWLFPWTQNHVKLNPSAIITNMRMKLDGTTLLDAAAANERGWTYVGRGYGNYQKKLDRNEGPAKTYTDAYGRANFDEQKLGTLAAMCDYCQARGIDFLVVAPPISAFNVFEYGDEYFEKSNQVRTLVESHGGEYYDFNMAKPSLFDVTNTAYFSDYQHMNAAGGAAVSAAFAQVMEMRAKGEDASQEFYEKAEYQQAMDYVDLVILRPTLVDDGVMLEAKALAGAGTKVEYQMCVQDAETGEWLEIRGWDKNPQCLFSPDKPGSYKLRVNAREEGSAVAFDRYRVVTVVV